MSKHSITTILGEGTEYIGKLTFKGTVRIDGKFSGEIFSEGSLIVGKGAIVTGLIKVSELIVNGSINADITASKYVILHKEAEVFGTLRTPKLEMEEGAMLQGELDMCLEQKKAPLNDPLADLSKVTTTSLEENIKQ